MFKKKMRTILDTMNRVANGDRSSELVKISKEDYNTLQRQLVDCRSVIAEQQIAIETLVRETRSVVSLSEHSECTSAQAYDREGSQAFDAFYMAFEDHFRGAPEEIKKRLEVYLPIIRKVFNAPSGDQMVLDLGCGRGEWLELLKEHGIRGKGIDTNRVALTRCKRNGLDVAEADALAYLREQGTASCSVITGFHIVEHLPLDVLMTVVRESFRVLQPGGLLIFETPDPENVIVGTRNFYIDPTHRNPIPDETLVFIAEYCGFVDIEIIKLQKICEPPSTDNHLINEVLRRFFMSQDYAITGYKPK